MLEALGAMSDAAQALEAASLAMHPAGGTSVAC